MINFQKKQLNFLEMTVIGQNASILSSSGARMSFEREGSESEATSRWTNFTFFLAKITPFVIIFD